jgi:hypothetical protein
MTKWLTGVRALRPGYAHVLVAPHVARSASGVEGAVGTPHGTVRVSVLRGTTEDGSAAADLRIQIPEGVERATLRLSAVLLARMGLDVVLADADSAAADLARVSVVESASESSAAGGPESNPPHFGAAVLAHPDDAPLLDESTPGSARSPCLEILLRPGAAYALQISVPPRPVSSSSSSSGPRPAAPWAPLGSPFPPPAWPGALVGTDSSTQGSWRGTFGSDGYFFPGFEVPSNTPTDPFCGTTSEGGTLELQCAEPGATISAIPFASFGTPRGSCPAFVNGSCNAQSSAAVVQAACVGKASCSVPATNADFGGDPCPGTSKSLSVVARCSSGGGSQPNAPVVPVDALSLPPYVLSVRAVNYDGFCGSTGNWANATNDTRALQDPVAAGVRRLGFTQPCGCPTSPVDILLTDAAKASGLRYRLSAYFVDWAPSPTCSALDGTARTQEVYLLTGYPDLSPAAPRSALTDFGPGIWLTWEVAGDIRIRISTVRGDMAVLSAVAFDPV